MTKKWIIQEAYFFRCGTWNIRANSATSKNKQFTYLQNR